MGSVSKIFKLGLLGLMIISLTAVNYLPVYGGQSAYSTDETAVCLNYSWMSKLDGNLPLNYLSIPGTHNTMATKTGGLPYVQCQSMSLMSQLVAGIRALDVRCANMGGSLQVYHGPVDMEVSLAEVVDTCISFLKLQPSESILIRVKMEDTMRDEANTNIVDFERAFREIYDHRQKAATPENSDTSWFWKKEVTNPRSSTIPLLDDIRGNIVVLQDFEASGGGTPYGLDWNNSNLMVIQDDYEPESLYSKWVSVREHQGLANASYGADDDKVYVNFLSANNWDAGIPSLSPWFVASGNISRSLDENLCSFIYDDGRWPDFPRKELSILDFYRLKEKYSNLVTGEVLDVLMDAPGISYVYDILDELVSKYNKSYIAKVLGKTSVEDVINGIDGNGVISKIIGELGLDDYSVKLIYYDGMNDLLSNRLSPAFNNTKKTGIVMADYPGSMLIDRVINMNSHLSEHIPSITSVCINPMEVYVDDEVFLSISFQNEFLRSKSPFGFWVGDKPKPHHVEVLWGDGQVISSDEVTAEMNNGTPGFLYLTSARELSGGDGVDRWRVEGSMECRHVYDQTGPKEVQVNVYVEGDEGLGVVEIYQAFVMMKPELEVEGNNDGVIKTPYVLEVACRDDQGDVHQIHIDWGDGTGEDETVSVPVGGSYTRILLHEYESYGSQNIDVVITDQNGDQATASKSVTMYMVPEITVSPLGTSLISGETLVVTGYVDDELDEDHILTVDWGIDGSPIMCTLVKTQNQEIIVMNSFPD